MTRSHPRPRAWPALPGLCFLLAFPTATARGGVTNPDISVVGQPLMTLTGDPGEPDRRRPVLDVGETEISFDAYLNPYARGLFNLSFRSEGVEMEEAYFTIQRGLPASLALKGGKYRAGFGALNRQHPHALPFAERFHLLRAYLPGDDGFNETGLDLSRLFPIAGDLAVTASLDWLQGDTFRRARTPSDSQADPLNSGGDDDASLTRAGYLARLSGSTLIGDRSAIEVGLSAAGGTNNVAAHARTGLYGGDAKVKLWNSANSYLLLQGEILALRRDEAAWADGSGYSTTRVDAAGGYLYADYNFGIRYNLGASYERFQQPVPGKPGEQSVGAFAGYALMEETTAFRADWRRTIPEAGGAFNTFTLRAIFSMGPHKAHQF